MKKILKALTEEILKSFGQKLEDVQHFDDSPLPEKDEVYRIIEDSMILLFPGYFGISDISFEFVEMKIGFKLSQLYERLKGQILRESQHTCRLPERSCGQCQDYSGFIAQFYISQIPKIRSLLDLDVKAAFRNDPAASSFDEIIFSYPGLEAVAVYRLAHIMFEKGLVLIPRIMTEWAHSKTGIDIHPGAKIGEGFFIDHGTGVVIGETSDIGNEVTIYQGVTLGALNFPKDAEGKIIRGAKRHPTIEDNVVIYAGATILGGSTVIGKGSVIGGNVWLTGSVSPFSKVVLGKEDLKIMTIK